VVAHITKGSNEAVTPRWTNDTHRWMNPPPQKPPSRERDSTSRHSSASSGVCVREREREEERERQRDSTAYFIVRVIHFESPISVSLVSFRRTVAKET